MTTIAAAAQATATPDGAAASGLGKQTLDYDAFLKLLVTQMQNQDPLNPMDSTEYMSQLASFSNVEQGLKMNSKLDQLLVLSNLAQANSVVGMSLTSADGATSGIVKSVKVTEGEAVATLTSGKTIKIESGVVFGAP
ncbi:MAG: flagellar hook assembly protein FlgD [Hyphomicrobium sp.]